MDEKGMCLGSFQRCSLALQRVLLLAELSQQCRELLLVYLDVVTK